MSGYTALATGLSIAAASRVRPGRHGALAWSGALLSVGSLPAFAGASMLLQRQARTSTGLPVMGAAVGVGSALAVAGHRRAGWRPAALSMVGAAGYLAYTRWYSWFGRERSPALEVGRTLPNVPLTTTDGKATSTAELVESPTVFVFYRGNWCPLCVAQVRELAASYRELAAAGARVVLVSPQPAGETAKLAERFDAPMDFVVDDENRAARALRIADVGGTPAGLGVLGYDSETVLPTVVIVDQEGVILFSDQTDNYRVRPEPATYLEVLRAGQAIGRTPTP